MQGQVGVVNAVEWDEVRNMSGGEREARKEKLKSKINMGA